MTKAALNQLRTHKNGRLAARPFECFVGRRDKRRKDIAHGFLAHATVTDMGVVEHQV